LTDDKRNLLIVKYRCQRSGEKNCALPVSQFVLKERPQSSQPLRGSVEGLKFHHPTFLSMSFFRRSSGLAPDSKALASVWIVGSANVRMRFDSLIRSLCATSLTKSFVSLST